MPQIETEEKFRVHALLGVRVVHNLFPHLSQEGKEQTAMALLDLEPEDLEPMTRHGYALSCAIPTHKTVWDYLEDDM
jgi:hypothetical protein